MSLFKPFLALVLFSVMSVPAISNAGTNTVSFPEGAVGISEDTYRQLKLAHCNIEQGSCDAIITQYADTIVFRVEAAGQMYVIQNKDGAPLIQRYLPDGFYKAGHHYYWIANNQKMRISKQTYYSKIVHIVQHSPNTFVPIVAFEKCGCLAEQYKPLNGKVLLLTAQYGELAYVTTTGEPAYITPTGFFQTIQQESVSVRLKDIKRIRTNND